VKAIIQKKYGSFTDLELQEVARPPVGDDDVLVRVRAASLHPDVWHMITGRPYVLRLMGAGLLRPRQPIPGTDMAGIVESVGARVRQFRPGDEVFGETIRSHQWTNGGAFAEYVSARPEWLACKPANITFEQAAAVPTSGFIALLNFREVGRLRPGQQVLVNGGAGGVGSIAVQLARAHGARVTAVDGPAKLSVLRSLGAHEVIDYTREDFTRRGIRYDLIFDVPGNRPYSELRQALAPDGRYIPIGHEHFGKTDRPVLGLLPHFLGLMLRARFVKQLRGPGLPAPTRQQAMAALKELLEAGKLTPIIASTYSLSEVGEALRHMVEDDPCGKVIITPFERDVTGGRPMPESITGAET
jgi:NADPH:quinone reductase-like Zn-dependent oxidoreductase